MKTKTVKIDWLIPLLGIALVCGGYFLVRSWIGFQEEVRSNEQLEVTLERVREASDLCQIMTQAKAGGCVVAAQHLDEMLAATLASDGVRIASTQAESRVTLETFIRFIDRRRSESPPMAGDVPGGGSGYGAAEQMMLAETH